MGTRKKKPEQAAPPRLEGRTPKESAANLRKEAQRISEYRNKPEVQRAIARNPALLQSLLEMEKIAAEFRIMANWLEQELGDMNAAEFAALNEYTEEWARNNPEQAAELVKNAGM